MITPGKLFKKPQSIPEDQVSADQLPRLAKGLLRYALKKAHAAQDIDERDNALASFLRATACIGERDLVLAGALINRLPVEGVPMILLHIAAEVNQEDELITQLRDALLAHFPDDGSASYTLACDERAKEVWARKTA
ncbi:MAG TPA: hypothetical protein VFH61_15440 [Thermoleophilia bacterium]|nr:hypothetical protein [Thermoleophilia bacterium]